MRIEPRRRTVAALAVALWALSSLPIAAQQRYPWDFPDAASRRAAEKRHSEMWFVAYPKASEALESGSPDVDDVIAMLRLSIHHRNRSEIRALTPTRDEVEYFPYYMLARAFAMKNDPTSAKRCTDKEREQGQITESSMAGDFAALETRITLLASLGTLTEHVGRAEAWQNGQAGVSLSPAGRQQVATVRAAAEAMNAATGGAEGALQPRARALIDALLGLCRTELEALEAREKKARGAFGSDNAAWGRAFSGGEARLADPAVCVLPAGEATPDTVERSMDAVEACSRRTLQLMRTAGAFVCAELDGKRQQAEKLGQQGKALTGSMAQVEALPETCNVGWNTAAFAQLDQALGGLDLARSGRGYDDQISALAGKIEGEREARTRREAAALAAVTAVLERLPRIPQRCVADLKVSAAAAKIARLQVPPKQAAQIDGFEVQVERAVQDLASGVEKGIGHLLSERDQCAGIDTTRFDELPGVLERYKRDADAGSLKNLCATAAGANKAVGDCWARNTPVVTEKLTDYRWLLESARGPQAAPECLASVAGAMRPAPPSRDVGSWVDRSREQLAEAQTCLQQHVDRTTETAATLAERVAEVGAVLRSTPGGETPGPGLQTIAERVDAVDTRLRELSALRQGSSVAELRERLKKAGAIDAVPSDWWPRLASLEGKDERYDYAVHSVVDRALLPTLAEADDGLPTWERLAESLGPFAALNAAFSAFAAGDLDTAIAGLRQAQAAGRVPVSGKPAALTHAALAYFLHTKSLTYGDRDDAPARRLLETDARMEARRAFQAMGEFELPSKLFASARFEAFFDSCREQAAAGS